MARKHVPDVLVCKAYVVAKANRIVAFEWPYDILHRWTGEPIKVCYRAMERARDHGLINYGTSLRSGWLTEGGIQLILADHKGGD